MNLVIDITLLVTVCGLALYAVRRDRKDVDNSTGL
jgi:hypothetical protein